MEKDPTRDPAAVEKVEQDADIPAAAPETSPQPPLTFVDVIAGVITQPNKTFAQIAANPRPWWGILSYIVVSLTSFISMFRSVQGSRAGFDLSFGLLFGVTVIGLVFWLFGIGATHLAAEILGGRGSAITLIAGSGLAQIPHVFIAPLTLGLRSRPGSMMFMGLISLVVGIWTLLLQAYAVKHTYKISTGRGLLAVLLPAIAIIVAFIFVIIGVLSTIGPVLRGFPRLPGLP